MCVLSEGEKPFFSTIPGLIHLQENFRESASVKTILEMSHSKIKLKWVPINT